MRFEIPGKPIPWARAGTNRGMYFDPQYMAKKNLRALIKEQIPEGFKPHTGAISVYYMFYLPTPKATPKYRKEKLIAGDIIPNISKIDTSNLIKFIEDTFNKILWEDDCLIWDTSAKKVWALEGKTVFDLIPTIV